MQYGVCAYFKDAYEDMKKTQPKLNYFAATSEIRSRFEGTPEWQGYLAWVREKYPDKDAVSKDPVGRVSRGAGGAPPAPI